MYLVLLDLSFYDWSLFQELSSFVWPIVSDRFTQNYDIFSDTLEINVFISMYKYDE